MKLELSARSHDLLFSREFNTPVIPVNPVTLMSFTIPLLQKYSLLGLKSHKCLTRLECLALVEVAVTKECEQ